MTFARYQAHIKLEMAAQHIRMEPDIRLKEIAAMFLTLGGRYFTVGSDAHKPENVAFGLNEAAKMLKSLGVKDACCFDKRKIITYPL